MIKFKVSNSKKYMFKIIWNSTIYIKNSKTSYKLGFYYLISLKTYQKIKIPRN